jgi:integrase
MQIFDKPYLLTCNFIYSNAKYMNMGYTVEEYLDMMVAAGRQPSTISSYRNIFKSFARFLEVPLDEVHNHLSSETLIKYVGSLKGSTGLTIRQKLTILRAYFVENGVQFKGMEMKVLNARRYSEPEDKPISLDHLQKMMDLTDERGKAFISVMVSTGMRAGEAAQLLVSDWDGKDTITIPGRIAKNGRGGKVYLTDEAQEYLTIWMRNRDKWILQHSTHPTEAFQVQEGKGDRLFASGYTGLNNMFRRLYEKIDGERGAKRGKITPHSLRKYFRTQAAAGGLHIDIVEKLMRHSGYLTGSYVRLDEDEVRKRFHEHEAALYITRHDHRLTSTKIDAQTREIKTLKAELQQVKQVQASLAETKARAHADPDYAELLARLDRMETELKKKD